MTLVSRLSNLNKNSLIIPTLLVGIGLGSLFGCAQTTNIEKKKEPKLEEKITQTNKIEIKNAQNYLSYLNEFEKNHKLKGLVKGNTSYFQSHIDIIKAKYSSDINKLSNHYKVPENVIYGILGVEKAQENEISKTGYIGLMQTGISSTKSSLRYLKIANLESLFFDKKELKKLSNKNIKNKLTNPQINLEIGTIYLKYLNSIFNDWSITAAAYQAGASHLAELLHLHRGATTGKWSGNGVEPLYKHLEDNRRIRINSKAVRNYVKNNKINILNLLNNPAVKNSVNELEKNNKWIEIQNYPQKVMYLASLN